MFGHVLPGWFYYSIHNAYEVATDSPIPWLIVSFHNEDKVWFSADWRSAYLGKQEANHLWQKIVHIQPAINLLDSEKELKNYMFQLKGKIMSVSRRSFWVPHIFISSGHLLRLHFFVDVTVPSLVKPDGSLIHCLRNQSTYFGNVDDSWQC